MLVLGVWLRWLFLQPHRTPLELRLLAGHAPWHDLLATGDRFAGNASFLTHLIKSLLNASGGVIDSLLSRETRRFVLLELLLFGRINGLVLASVS